MKYFLLLSLLISGSSMFGQDTSKVEQYCEMVAAGRLLSTKINIDVNYGEARKFFKSYGVKDDNGKLQKFNSVVDALNYLGSQGWRLVNAYPITESSSSGTVLHFYLKKEFLKSDVENAEKD